jgi:hypothetical protein
MNRWLYMMRFFAVVPPMPLLMIGAFGTVTAAIAVIIAFDPSRARDALTPILLLQVFACASGFDVPARRGHYDLLLTHTGSRRLVLFGHWLASSCPGVVCWLLLAAACRIAAGPEAGGLLVSTGSAAAVCLVSTIPWAATTRLPRFSGAIGWLLTAATLALATPQIFSPGAEHSMKDWSSWMWTAGTVLLYPPLLVGRDLHATEALLAVPGLLVAAGALALALWSAERRDIPLEAAQ